MIFNLAVFIIIVLVFPTPPRYQLFLQLKQDILTGEQGSQLNTNLKRNRTKVYLCPQVAWFLPTIWLFG